MFIRQYNFLPFHYVAAPARVLTEGVRVTGHAGQTVTVTCEATGDAPLTFTWLHHHSPVSPSHRLEFYRKGISSYI